MELSWVLVTGKAIIRKLFTPLRIVKRTVGFFWGLAFSNFVTRRVQDQIMSSVWIPWIIAIGRSVWIELRKRLNTNAWLVWILAIGQLPLEMLNISVAFCLCIPRPLYMFIKASINSIRTKRITTPDAFSVPSTPNLTQGPVSNDTSSTSPDDSTHEAPHPDPEDRLREQYMQALIDQRPPGSDHTEGSLHYEPDSEIEPEFTSAPSSPRWEYSMPEQAPAA